MRVKLAELIQDTLAQIIGPIRQEILSGLAQEEQFKKLRDYLSAFDDIPIVSQDYELAAEFYNRCRRKGVQGSNTDFLICAVAVHQRLAIFTLDHDFYHFSKFLPIKIYKS